MATSSTVPTELRTEILSFEEEIRLRAHEISLQSDGRDGSDMADLLQKFRFQLR